MRTNVITAAAILLGGLFGVAALCLAAFLVYTAFGPSPLTFGFFLFGFLIPAPQGLWLGGWTGYAACGGTARARRAAGIGGVLVLAVSLLGPFLFAGLSGGWGALGAAGMLCAGGLLWALGLIVWATRPPRTAPVPEPSAPPARWLAPASALAAGLIWLVWAGEADFYLPGDADFYLHRAKYQAIVARVKARPLALGAARSEQIDVLQVEAARGPSGAYALTITTEDWHHAGSYGYVFSDTPLAAREDDPDGPSVPNPGSFPSAGKAILGQGGHWWSVHDGTG